MEGGQKVYENLRASPFNKELSNETTFSLIHHAVQKPPDLTLKWRPFEWTYFQPDPSHWTVPLSDSSADDSINLRSF